MTPVNVAEFVARLNALLAAPSCPFVAEQRPYIDAFVAHASDNEVLTPSAFAAAWDATAREVGAKRCEQNAPRLREDAMIATLHDLVTLTCDDDFAIRVRAAMPMPRYEAGRQTLNIPAGSWFSSR